MPLWSSWPGCVNSVKGGCAAINCPSGSESRDFDELRKNAFEQEVEWGSCVVWGQDRLGLPHAARGWAEGVSPLCEPIQHNLYAGFAHVHLPDTTTGLPYFGFSDLDFRASFEEGDRLALVTNGPEVFALARTLDHTLPTQRIHEAEFDAWTSMYDNAVSKARKQRASDALDRALWDVNQELCRRLGFAFYRGAWGRPLELVFNPAEEASENE